MPERTGKVAALLIEAEAQLSLAGTRYRLNRQPLRRNDELLGAVLVTVFSPDDIEMVKGGPQMQAAVPR